MPTKSPGWHKANKDRLQRAFERAKRAQEPLDRQKQQQNTKVVQSKPAPALKPKGPIRQAVDKAVDQENRRRARLAERAEKDKNRNQQKNNVKSKDGKDKGGR